jgi:hypothetical protein
MNTEGLAMNTNHATEWTASHFQLYTSESIHSLYTTTNKPVYRIKENAAVLIAVAGGKAVLTFQDHLYELMEGSVILLPANGEAELIANHQISVHAYKIAINTQEQWNTRVILQFILEILGSAIPSACPLYTGHRDRRLQMGHFLIIGAGTGDK